MNTLTKIFVGVDVSKDFLDLHFHPIKKTFRVTNDEKGIKQLFKRLQKYSVNQIVFEATGGYEYLLRKALEKGKYLWWLVEPRRIRAFIISEGVSAKTDTIDAQMIALFASQKISSHTQIAVSQEIELLQSLTRRRDDVMKMITQEKNRMKHPAQIHCKSGIEVHILSLQEIVASLDQKIQKSINKNEALKTKEAIITSMPGIGPVTASVLIAQLPELGQLTNKKVAALVGLAPIIKQSGADKGYATTRGGRKVVRVSLYMAAVVAIRFNPVFKIFYARLRKDGKKFKVAIVAVMRKIIEILNAMVQKGERWRVA